MIKIYSPKGDLVGIIEPNMPVIEREINLPPTLLFDVDFESSKLIQLEGLAKTEVGDYIVKEKKKNNMGYSIVCKPDFSSLQSDLVSHDFKTVTAEKMIGDILGMNSGWTYSVSGSEKRSLKINERNKYDSIFAVADTFRYEIFFDVELKKITMRNNIGDNSGKLYIHDEVNLVNLVSTSDSYDVYTRIIPRGKDGLDITSVNGGKPYIDNFQYSNKVKPLIWEDERYTVAENLKEDAIKKLMDLSKPHQSFEIGIINLHKLDNEKWEFLKLEVGDFVDLVSSSDGVDTKQRIVKKIGELDGDGTNDKIVIANLSRNFVDENSEDSKLLKEAMELVEEVIIEASEGLEADYNDKFKAIGDMIKGENGGYKIDRYNELGQAYETLYLDNTDINKAVNVIAINKSGITFSTNGIAGPFNTAMSIDGKIAGKYIIVDALETITANFGTMTAGRIQDADNESYWDLDNKEIKLNVDELTINSKQVVTEDTYNNEKPTYGATAPTVKPVGKLWVDTSVTPNLLKRWDGTKWVIINDTSALKQRVQEAEQKILPSAIIGTVKEATNQDNEPLFAKTSEVKQTVDDVRFSFDNQIIGGANLIRNSNFELGLKNFSPWGDTIVTKSNPNIMKMVMNGTHAVGIQTDGYYIPMKAGEKYTLSFIGWDGSLGTDGQNPYFYILDEGGNVSFGSKNTLTRHGRVPISVLGSTNYAHEFSMTFTMPIDVTQGRLLLAFLFEETLPYKQWYVGNIKLEKGDKRTGWSPHPDELYAGVTKIDKDGVTVGREGETIETNLGFDGLRVSDGATEIASFTGSGASIKSLDAESISGDVINIMNSSMTFDIGTGSGYYADFSEVLGAIGNRKHLADDITLTINIRSVLNETIRIEGFSGGGIVELNIYSRVNGYIKTSSNSCRIQVYGKNKTHVVSGSGETITSSADAYTLFSGLNIDSKNTASGVGIMSRMGSNVYVEYCDFVNVRTALYAVSAGKIQTLDNKGNVTKFAAVAENGRIWLRGTIPNGDTYGFIYNFAGLARTASSFSPPPTTTGPETRTFNHTDIYTYSVKYGAVSTHYGKAAAQNRWDTSMTQMKGRIVFGSSVYSFISGRNSGTTPTVKIRLRRQNSTHGASSSVKPTPEWSGAPSFGGATRGNWTPWVTIPYTLFTSSGYTFSFYNGTTGSSYAIWDRAEVQITRTVTQ